MSVKYFFSACCSSSRLSTMKPFSTSDSTVSRSSMSNVLWPFLIRSSRPVTSGETRSCASEKVFIRNTSFLSGSGTCTLKTDGCMDVPLSRGIDLSSGCVVRKSSLEKYTVSVHRGSLRFSRATCIPALGVDAFAHSDE